jgi:hypothetical protein
MFGGTQRQQVTQTITTPTVYTEATQSSWTATDNTCSAQATIVGPFEEVSSTDDIKVDGPQKDEKTNSSGNPSNNKQLEIQTWKERCRIWNIKFKWLLSYKETNGTTKAYIDLYEEMKQDKLLLISEKRDSLPSLSKCQTNPPKSLRKRAVEHCRFKKARKRKEDEWLPSKNISFISKLTYESTIMTRSKTRLNGEYIFLRKNMFSLYN